MDKEVLEAKIAALIRCVHRVKSQGILSLEDLEKNIDKQDIIILNLQRAVQICVDIGNHILLDYDTETPATMAETFRKLAQNKLIPQSVADNLSRAVGFRNIAVHQYENLDCKIIYAIITSHLDDFRNFASEIEKLI
ncbi:MULTISPECIES: DUF86 domain-containing protein [unclassified Treponema]|mgnify:FL=1|uniref:type VII toxin-antitoxin system HepT family RNase toxin n=1 Tax=unclassified Treponema TaxID=2638727 RepID=UPI0025F2EE45|nr:MULTISPECIES: DUF86 domain-containing protein [unclassified Treponema]MBQ8678197.1 DUF86 domain-containing protein [Treponema sp.]